MSGPTRACDAGAILLAAPAAAGCGDARFSLRNGGEIARWKRLSRQLGEPPP
jgi:hypothetical protein